MANITGLTAFASPNIDVSRSGDSKSWQQELLQNNIARLKASDNDYDHSLAPLLSSALELSRARETVIQTLLDQGKDPRTKAYAIEQMSGIRTKAMHTIRAALVNRLVSYGVLESLDLNNEEEIASRLNEVVDLVEVTSTQGYYHDVQSGRDYAKSPLTAEESLRALEPATMITLKQASDPTVAAEIIRAVGEIGDYFAQYSILIAGAQALNGHEIGDVTQVQEVPILQTSQHRYDLIADTFRDQTLSNEIIRTILSEDTYKQIAQNLAEHGFAGATFNEGTLELFYIKDYDPQKRDYSDWADDLKIAMAKIQNNLITIGRSLSPGIETNDQLPQGVETGKPLALLVVYQGGNSAYTNFAEYAQITAKQSSQTRQEIAKYLV